MLNDTVQQGRRNVRDDGLGRIVSDMTELADKVFDDLAVVIEAVQAKDRNAFGVLYDATVQRVFSLALRITRQQELAEEVVSDVYFQVWQRADSYSPQRGKVIAWLCVLCRSRALDALRRGNTAIRQAQVSVDTVPELEDPIDSSSILHAVEQGSAIHMALAKLSNEQRQLVALAYFRGYTHSQLANFLGIPIGTVKTNLRRAMIMLKEMMLNGDSDE